MATTPNFTNTPVLGAALVNTADTNTDGTSGTRATVLAAGANGTRLDAVRIHGIVANGSTQAADSVRFWLFNGTTTYFLTEQLIPAGGGAVSATVANVDFIIALGFDLPNAWSLLASTDIGGSTASYHVTAFGGNY